MGKAALGKLFENIPCGISLNNDSSSANSSGGNESFNNCFTAALCRRSSQRDTTFGN